MTEDDPSSKTDDDWKTLAEVRKVQVDTYAKEVARLRDELTAANLERDALKRKTPFRGLDVNL
jgi:hypothetical protein